MSVRVGINGFGRIGRNVFRAAAQGEANIEIVAVNDITDTATLAHLLDYDSIFGRYPGDVHAHDEHIHVDDAEVRVFAERDPAKIAWGDVGVDVVVESTGFFTDRDKAALHLRDGRREGDHLRARPRAPTSRSASASTTRTTTPRSTTSSRTRPAPPTAWPRWPRC